MSTGADSCFQRAELVAAVGCRWGLHPSYMHSFCMTAGYFVLVEQPLAVSTVQVCKTLLQRQPLVAALRWFDEPVSAEHPACPLSYCPLSYCSLRNLRLQ